MYRDKILLRRRTISRRVTLPSGRSFVARYKRVSRKSLPANVTIKRNRIIGPRQKRKHKTQKGSRLLGTDLRLGKNLLISGAVTKGITMGSRAINSDLGKKLIDKSIKHAPDLYRCGKERVTNKTLKKALESDFANYVAEKVEENFSAKNDKGDMKPANRKSFQTAKRPRHR